MKAKIKSCPHCGCKDIEIIDTRGQCDDPFWISCVNCRAAIPAGSRKKAIQAWNKRTTL